MSLINDALKRAKESQGQTPPPVTPVETAVLRPVESAPSKGLPTWVWVVIIVLLVGFGAFLIGQSTHKMGGEKSQMPVATENPSQPAKVSTAESTPVAAKPPVAETVKTTPVAAAPSPAPAPLQTSAAPVVAAAPVAPVPTLKLQSIIFDPRRPSAMINGKSLFVGDKISGFYVVKILKNSVTVIGAGRTNILELEE